MIHIRSEVSGGDKEKRHTKSEEPFAIIIVHGTDVKYRAGMIADYKYAADQLNKIDNIRCFVLRVSVW